MSSSRMRKQLVSLPYDVRYLIYHHLFPPGGQIYIHVVQHTMKSILADHTIPINLMLVNHQLHVEASEYLYNNYLFNIVGTKKECLISYESFAETIRKYAREEVRIDAFSNGDHSATMCISLQSGTGSMALLQSRGRGELKDIKDLKTECGLDEGGRQSQGVMHMVRTLVGRANISAAALAVSILAALVAWLLSHAP